MRMNSTSRSRAVSAVSAPPSVEGWNRAIVLISVGDRFVSMLDHKLEPKAVRRVEVITGPGGRRRFSDDEKARIIEEALVPGAVISAWRARMV